MSDSEMSPKRSLTTRIVIGMTAGIAVGVVLNGLLTSTLEPEGTVSGLIQGVLIDGVFYVGGAIFMASLKLLVVPLVFVSLVCGTASLEDVSRLGRIGGKTLGLYLLTTAIAVSLALLTAILIAPGEGLAGPRRDPGEHLPHQPDQGHGRGQYAPDHRLRFALRLCDDPVR